MPLNIRNEEVNQLAEELARRKRVNKTDAVKLALRNELRRLDQVVIDSKDPEQRDTLDETLPLRERIRPIQDRILAYPPTGLEADKAFFDDLSGEV